jgi:hypothetical protein
VGVVDVSLSRFQYKKNRQTRIDWEWTNIGIEEIKLWLVIDDNRLHITLLLKLHNRMQSQDAVRDTR